MKIDKMVLMENKANQDHQDQYGRQVPKVIKGRQDKLSLLEVKLYQAQREVLARQVSQAQQDHKDHKE